MTCCTTTSPDEAPTRAGPWVRILVAAFLAFNSMVAALAVNLSEVSLAERRWLHVGLFVATAIVAALVGGPLVRRTAEALRRGKVTVEALFIAGMAGAFAYSLYHAVVGSGAVYFEIVSILLVIYALGTQIKQQVQSRVLASTQAFSPAAATCQTLTCCGKLVEKPVSAVNVGDSVRVFPGQVIPVDGVILEGASFVRQSALTGEPAAVPRKAGDAVFAATHALDGTLTLRATARGDDRRIDHIVRAVEQARGRRSHLERQADRLAAWFFPVVATASAGTFAGWAWFGTYEAAFLNAMAVLLIACPCALGFATPVGIWSALARLGRRGFVVRDAGAVEHMAAVDTVLFDKTGTLTDAEAGDVTLHVLHGQDEHRVRAMVAAAEAASDHPVARQLRALVPADGTSGWSAVAAEAIPGVGFRANVRDGAGAVCEVMIVNAATRAADGASDASAEREEELDVLMNGHLVARVVVDERPLAGRADAFAELQAMGLDVRVLSGDTGERIERLRGKRGTSPL
ncbi:MAG: heavy metal translocating P-type ATPase, partial [Phycisphaerae bacterium]